jgi:hypothetical protein
VDSSDKKYRWVIRILEILDWLNKKIKKYKKGGMKNG